MSPGFAPSVGGRGHDRQAKARSRSAYGFWNRTRAVAAIRRLDRGQILEAPAPAGGVDLGIVMRSTVKRTSSEVTGIPSSQVALGRDGIRRQGRRPELQDLARAGTSFSSLSMLMSGRNSMAVTHADSSSLSCGSSVGGIADEVAARWSRLESPAAPGGRRRRERP